MATCTLFANATWTQVLAGTNIDAVPVNNDTVALNGYQLTFDIVPTLTGIECTAVGNAGTVVFPTGTTTWPFTGWVFRAGTANLCTTINAGNTVGGTWWGSNSNSVRAITTNNGTLTGVLNAGTAANADAVGTNGVNGIVSGELRGNTASVGGGHGCTTNNGIISGSIYGGTGTRGLTTNNAIVTGTVYAGASGAGIQTNYGTVYGDLIAGGGSTNHSAINENMGIVSGNVTGGSASGRHGIGLMSRGAIITLDKVLTDGSVGKAVGSVPVTTPTAPILFIRGSNMQGTIPTGFATVYHIGAIAGTIGGSPTMVELFETGGSSPIIVIEGDD